MPAGNDMTNPISHLTLPGRFLRGRNRLRARHCQIGERLTEQLLAPSSLTAPSFLRAPDAGRG